MPPDSIRLDAADGDGFESYREFYGRATDIDLTSGRFQAQVDVFRVPRMVVHERRVRGVLHRRDWARVSRYGFDHIALHVLVAGDMVAGPADAERRLAPGEILVVDTARPHVSRMDGAHLFSVQLGRGHVHEALGEVDHLHGTVLPAAAGGLLADFVGSFARRVNTLPPDTVGHAARSAIELLGLGLKGAQASAAVLSSDAGDALRRTRAEAFIAAHLSSPALDADAVAAGIGTSRSNLYRVFGEDGGVKRFIQRRRLEGLRRALLHPGEVRPLGSLAHAYGFASQSHCNRAFAAAFGMPPGRFRAGLRQGRGVEGGRHDWDATIARWASELF